MNFNDSSTDRPVGAKNPARKSNDAGVEVGHEHDIDRSAMDSAQKAQERQHKNENTNSSNTIFSK